MKIFKKLFSVKRAVSTALIIGMIWVLNLSVFAASDASPEVATAREGVLQINYVYQDQSGRQHVLKTGSGFLLGPSTGATTVITNNHVVTLDRDEMHEFSEEYGVDFTNLNNLTIRIQIVVKRDVVVDASYKQGSDQMDFAILELSQAIYDRKPLKVAPQGELVETSQIYALGFPLVATRVSDGQTYTSSDVTITSGIVGKFQTIDNIPYILHNAGLGHGNSGGPLVDSNGCVVGVNTMYSNADSANTYYYSVDINEITGVMDALGYVYERGGTVTPNPSTEPTEPTEPSSVNPDPSESVIPSSSDIGPVDPGTDDGPNWLLIGIIVGIVLLAILLFIIVIIVLNGSKKSNTTPTMMNPAMYGQQPGQQSMQSSATGVMPTPAPPTPGPSPVRPPMPPVFDSGAGETSVLGVGSGETSVLGGGSSMPSATLIRKKNGENISINRPSFSIGKERAKVDYCVPDNNSISRSHASIVCKGGVYYIVDNNSTNFTFVNGNKISARTETMLNSGDKIKLADEEFEFRM